MVSSVFCYGGVYTFLEQLMIVDFVIKRRVIVDECLNNRRPYHVFRMSGESQDFSVRSDVTFFWHLLLNNIFFFI